MKADRRNRLKLAALVLIPVVSWCLFLLVRDEQTVTLPRGDSEEDQVPAPTGPGPDPPRATAGSREHETPGPEPQAGTSLADAPGQPSDSGRAAAPSSGGGLRLVLLSEGERLPVDFLAFVNIDPDWTGAFAGKAPPVPRVSFEQARTAASIPGASKMFRYAGRGGEVLIPFEGYSPVSVALVVPGWDLVVKNALEVKSHGEEPHVVAVELRDRSTGSLSGRLVHPDGAAAVGYTVNWSPEKPLAPWRNHQPTGVLPFLEAGTQWSLHRHLSVSAQSGDDGHFQIRPVLDSDRGVIRVFVGSSWILEVEPVQTAIASESSTGEIVVPRHVVVPVRLSLPYGACRYFGISVKGVPVPAPAMGVSALLDSDSTSVILLAIPASASEVQVTPIVSWYAGRAVLDREARKAGLSALVFPAHQLVNRALSEASMTIDASVAIDDLTIHVSDAALRDVMASPESQADVARLRRALHALQDAVPEELRRAVESSLLEGSCGPMAAWILR